MWINACAGLWLGHDHRLPKRNSISMVKRVVTIFPFIVNGSLPFVMVILKCPLRTNGPSSLVVIAVIVLYSLQNHNRSDLSELCTNYICMETSEVPHTFHISSALYQRNELQVFFRFVGKLTVQLKLLMSFLLTWDAPSAMKTPRTARKSRDPSIHPCGTP